MASPLLQVRGVSKRFGADVILDDVSLTVERGEVVGLAGPNGAGKSTLMRIICRLVRPTAGNVLLDGAGLDSDPDAYLRHIGSLIDAPGVYPYMTARQHVDFVAGIRGRTEPRTSVDILHSVGLDAASGKIARHFSLGMRQRLGIAMATVHDPRLLVLDEPMNGLDPLGMKDLRETIARLSTRGVAVLISSHLLSEIEHMCARIAILHRGRLVSDSSLQRAGASACARMLVNTTANQSALDALRAAGLEVTTAGDGLQCTLPRSDIPTLATLLVGAGVGLLELREIQHSLEHRFLETLNDRTGREA